MTVAWSMTVHNECSPLSWSKVVVALISDTVSHDVGIVQTIEVSEGLPLAELDVGAPVAAVVEAGTVLEAGVVPEARALVGGPREQ